MVTEAEMLEVVGRSLLSTPFVEASLPGMSRVLCAPVFQRRLGVDDQEGGDLRRGLLGKVTSVLRSLVHHQDLRWAW